MRTRLLHQRLLALFVAGWLFFDFPLLSLWTRAGSGWLLPLALFVGWAVLIGVLAWWMEGAGASADDEPRSGPAAKDDAP